MKKIFLAICMVACLSKINAAEYNWDNDRCGEGGSSGKPPRNKINRELFNQPRSTETPRVEPFNDPFRAEYFANRFDNTQRMSIAPIVPFFTMLPHPPMIIPAVFYLDSESEN